MAAIHAHVYVAFRSAEFTSSVHAKVGVKPEVKVTDETKQNSKLLDTIERMKKNETELKKSRDDEIKQLQQKLNTSERLNKDLELELKQIKDKNQKLEQKLVQLLIIVLTHAHRLLCIESRCR